MQLVEQCLANLAEDRPSADEVLQQLGGMDIDYPHQGVTRLDMIRRIGQNEEEIQRLVQESQQMGEQRDEEIQQKEQMIEQMGEEVRQRDVVIHQRDEEIQHKEDEVRQKSEEIRQMDEEKQSLQSQVDQLQVYGFGVHYLTLPELPHTLYLSTMEAQVQEVEAAKERKAARVEALTNQTQELEGQVQQLKSEVEDLTSRGAILMSQVHQLQVCVWYALPKLT